MTKKVTLTLGFEDATSRNYTFNGVDTEIDEQTIEERVKEKVKAINANMSENFKSTFVSNIGAKVRLISKAVVTTIDEEEFYNAY